MSVLLETLKNKFHDEKDDLILFDEPSHKYTIITDPHSKYTSVTTWIHTHFPHFNPDSVIKKMMNGKNWTPDNKYWGMTPEQIKNEWKKNGEAVSSFGTNLHFDIECFMNYPVETDDTNTYVSHAHLLEYYHEQYTAKNIAPPNQSEEWGYFLKFAEAFPHLIPYRTEKRVYDEDLKFSGSIDMIYYHPEDDSISIYDWKRSKEISKVTGFNEYANTECINHLPNTNYWHYSLQLNIYKAIIERKYNKKVRDLYLVRLHPNNTRKTFDLIKCADLSQEVSSLFEYRKQELDNVTAK